MWAKDQKYDPGGIVVGCRRCGYQERIAFDVAPFIDWPPRCPRCTGVISPMLSVAVQKRRKIDGKEVEPRPPV